MEEEDEEEAGGPDDSVSPVELPAGEVEMLRARAKERDSLLEQLQRSRAEFQNYQRRVERDRASWSQDAVARFVASLIPALDDVDRALQAARKAKDFSALERGLAMMEKSFRAHLVEQGLKPIDALGAPFDPRLHEAVQQETREDLPEGTIIAELRKGYTLGERVIRPAQVIVSKREEEAPETEEESES